MIVDIHTHAFPKVIRHQRERFFPNEPAFKLLYETPNARLVSATETIATMDAEAVDVSVVFGFPWGDIDTCRLNNDYIIEAVQRHPDRLKGFCCVDPFLPEAPEEVARCLDAGLSGVGELAFYRSGIDDPCVACLAPILEICRGFDVPVMVHTNEPVGHAYPGKTPVTLEQINALARTFPENKIILAHWGGGIFFYHIMKKQLKGELKNIWYDTAASVFLYDSRIYDMAVTAGVLDKILFGTDYPLLKPGRYYEDLDRSGLTQRQKDMVLGKNAEIFYGR